MIINMGGYDGLSGKMPEFTYSGTHALTDEGKDGIVQNWKAKFTTSGVLVPKRKMVVDVFIVAGGGGSGSASGGAGSGRTLTVKNVTLAKGTSYSIVIGEGGSAAASTEWIGGTGGTSSAFGYSADGGMGGTRNSNTVDGVGGSGGSGGGGYNGGKGGTDGADGTDGALTSRVLAGGDGLDETTREFWETTGELYASGGDGAITDYYPGNATANTGNGASGNAPNTTEGLKGGSGIVIIRNAR